VQPIILSVYSPLRPFVPRAIEDAHLDTAFQIRLIELHSDITSCVQKTHFGSDTRASVLRGIHGGCIRGERVGESCWPL